MVSTKKEKKNLQHYLCPKMFCVIRNLRELNFEPVKFNFPSPFGFSWSWSLLTKQLGKKTMACRVSRTKIKNVYVEQFHVGEVFFHMQQSTRIQSTIYNRKLKVRHLFSDKGGQKYKTLVASKANSFLPCLVISTLHSVRSVSSGPKVYKLQQDMGA